MEHYKLSFLIKTEHGAAWDDIYIRIDNGKPEIVLQNSHSGNQPLNSKIESITKEEFQKVWNDSRIDFGH